MILLRSVFLTVLILLGALGTSRAAIETAAPGVNRVALVVGIGAYQEAPPLPNAVSDARAVAAELWRSGFEVIELLDADINTLRASLRVVSERLKPASQVAVFFAGHGVQIDEQNFLLARDVELRGTVDNVLRAAISANEITNTFANSAAELTIVILDACRNNPFAPAEELMPDAQRGLRVATSDDTPGLAPIIVRSPSEVLIAFSTSPGNVALDGPEGGHSPFATALIQNIQAPSVPVESVFENVRADVLKATAGRQEPWISDQLDRDFVFRTGTLASGRGQANEVDTLGLLPPSLVIERSLWNTAQISGQSEDIEAYLTQFPDGSFADLARAELERRTKVLAQNGVVQPTAFTADSASRDIKLLAGVTFPVDRAIAPDLLQSLGKVRVLSLPESLDLRDQGGQPIHPGDEVEGAGLAEATFVVGERLAGDIGMLSLEDLSGTPGADLVFSVSVDFDTCDLVAGYPHDPNRVGRGARLELMKPLLAIAACQSAVSRFPDSPRFKALLGRAYRSAADFDKSRHWNDQAIADGYSAAFAAEGKMLLLGQGGPVDLEKSFDYFSRAAALDDSFGLTGVGEAYLFGRGVPVDAERGLDLIRQATGLGNDWAHTLMGRIYENGWGGIAVSPEAAFDWYRKAAEMGDPSAKLELADAYRNGAGTPVDKNAAFSWIESAAGQGWTFAQARFGLEYAKGDLTPVDDAMAVYWYRRSADGNDPEGQYYLANALIDGKGTDPDPDLGLALLQIARGTGHVQSILKLAELAEKGRAMAQDLPAAERYYQEAWDAGFMPAGRPLAKARAEGYSGRVDGEGAVAVLREVIEKSQNSWAMRDLAALYKAGKAVPRDPAESARITQMAVDAGNEYALRELAQNLETGFGVKEDKKAAFESMIRAAHSPSAWARLDLARYFAQGVGTKPDPVGAAYWFARAASAGDAGAAKAAAERVAGTDPDAMITALGLLSQEAAGAKADRGTALAAGEAVLAARTIARADEAAIFDAMKSLAETAPLPAN